MITENIKASLTFCYTTCLEFILIHTLLKFSKLLLKVQIFYKITSAFKPL